MHANLGDCWALGGDRQNQVENYKVVMHKAVMDKQA